MYCVQVFDGTRWAVVTVDWCPERVQRLSSRLYREGLPSRAVPLSWAVRHATDEIEEYYVD